MVLCVLDNHGSAGGSLYVDGCDVVRISGCYFVDSVAKQGGGAYFNNDNTHVDVIDCVFDKCTAMDGLGGGIGVHSDRHLYSEAVQGLDSYNLKSSKND